MNQLDVLRIQLEPKRTVPSGQLVRALKCANVSGEPHECIGSTCPYFVTATEEEVEKFNQKHGTHFKADFFDGCDSDRMALDAAERIAGLEQLVSAYNKAMKKMDDQKAAIWDNDPDCEA